MKKTFAQLVDFALPRFCAGCQSRLDIDENAVCNACIQSIKLANKERIELEYRRKFADVKVIEDFISLYIFEQDGTLQNIIHSIKYDKKFLAGILMGKKLAEEYKSLFRKWAIDCIVSVPLHHLKTAERGYNQSYYISKGITKVLKVKTKPKVLKRIRYTESQTTLTLKEREVNISEAFKVKKIRIIEDKNILLVDDVITTGATIRECGKVLLEKGARKIYSCSVAIAQ